MPARVQMNFLKLLPPLTSFPQKLDLNIFFFFRFRFPHLKMSRLKRQVENSSSTGSSRLRRSLARDWKQSRGNCSPSESCQFLSFFLSRYFHFVGCRECLLWYLFGLRVPKIFAGKSLNRWQTNFLRFLPKSWTRRRSAYLWHRYPFDHPTPLLY